MMHARAASAYRKVDLESAPKDQILDRLLARFLVDVAVAGRAIEANDIEAKSNAINHASQILIELKAALAWELAPELCANLARLYDYANERLSTANLNLSVSALGDATKVIGAVADSFILARERR